MTRNEIEEAMKQIVRDMTVELMDYGGTTPEATRDSVVEDFPELTEAFGDDRLLTLCKVVLESIDPAESARLQKLFRIFNVEYFSERLGDYEVLAVYDVGHWEGNFSGEVTSGYTDHGRSRIFIGMTKRRAALPSLLLHHMAHALTATSDDDEIWTAEMERLRNLGAPADGELIPSPIGIASCHR